MYFIHVSRDVEVSDHGADDEAAGRVPSDGQIGRLQIQASRDELTCVGTWGVELFSDDLAADLRVEFRDLIGEGSSAPAAVAKGRKSHVASGNLRCFLDRGVQDVDRVLKLRDMRYPVSVETRSLSWWLGTAIWTATELGGSGLPSDRAHSTETRRTATTSLAISALMRRAAIAHSESLCVSAN